MRLIDITGIRVAEANLPYSLRLIAKGERGEITLEFDFSFLLNEDGNGYRTLKQLAQEILNSIKERDLEVSSWRILHSLFDIIDSFNIGRHKKDAIYNVLAKQDYDTLNWISNNPSVLKKIADRLRPISWRKLLHKYPYSDCSGYDEDKAMDELKETALQALKEERGVLDG